MKLSFITFTAIVIMSGTLWASNGKAQNISEVKVSISVKATALDKVLQNLQQQSGLNIMYNIRDIGAKRMVNADYENQSLETVLTSLFKNTNIGFRQEDDNIYINKRPVPGKIAGKVLDEKGEPLPGATIRVVETGLTIQSNVDGTYQLSLAPGTYTIDVSFVSYQPRRTTGIIVADGRTTPLDIAMQPATNALATVTITSDYKRSSVEGLYAKQKNNIAMTDGISAEQIARTPDKNIGETLKRISGVSVLENKYVVVRGLGERYNGTMMNGQIMPSTELNRKQFSFDIIPSNMVDNVTIYKTINPDKSAEFGGGLIEVNTKSIPTENSFSITFGENYNDHTTGKNFRGGFIGTSSYFGSATGDRTLLGKRDWKSSAAIKDYYASKNADAKLFSNNWKLYNYKPLPSQNFQASLARVINLKQNNQIGFIASASYRNTWQTQDVISGRNGYPGSDLQDELYGFAGKRYGFTTNLGGIIGAGYSGQGFKVSLQSILLRTFDQQLLLGTGVKDDLGWAVGYYDLTTQTSLWQNQLRGEKGFGKKGIKLDWQLSYTIVDRQKPDNHQFDAQYIGNETDGPDVKGSDFTIYNITAASDLGVLRSWTRSFEKNLGWDIDLTVPVKFDLLKTAINNSFKTGYAGWRKDRLFWVLNTGSGFGSGFNPEPLSEKFDPVLNPNGTISISRFGDDYNHTAALHAGYVMLDSKIGSKFRLTGGVRGEYYDLNRVNTLLQNFVRIQRDQNHDLTDYSNIFGIEPKFNLFPSAALSYALTQKMNLRLSYAKSIIRPDLRELSYFKEYDYELGGSYTSNSPIRSTKIQNIDFRYEWYPGAGEILSASLFYKNLKNPMEIYDAGNRQFELRNDISAKNKGIELEARKSFAFTGIPVIRNLTLYGNFTRLFAKVTPTDVNKRYVTAPDNPNKLIVLDVALPEVNRPQAGASNYTYNGAIYYDSKLLSLSLSYNYITNRVFRASSNYKESLFETPLPSMDGQIAVNVLKNKGQVKMNFSNILNKSNRVYQKRQGENSTTLFYEKADFINYQASPGRTYGLSFNYNF